MHEDGLLPEWWVGDGLRLKNFTRILTKSPALRRVRHDVQEKHVRDFKRGHLRGVNRLSATHRSLQHGMQRDDLFCAKVSVNTRVDFLQLYESLGAGSETGQ